MSKLFNSHSLMGKLTKVTLYILAAVCALLILLAIISQTPMFKNFVLEQIISSLNKNLNGTISGGRLSGNLFTNVQIDDIALDVDEQPFVTIEKIVLQFKPLALLSHRVIIDEAHIKHPYFVLHRTDDSLQWNYERLFNNRQKTSSRAGQPWDVAIESVRIEAGTARIEKGNDKSINLPAWVRELNLHLGVWFHGGKLKASLEKLNFITEEPAFSVHTIKSEVYFGEKNLRTANLDIATELSRFTSSVDISDLQNPVLNLVLSGKPISFEEIRRIWPQLKLYGDPRIELEVEGPLHDLNINGDIFIGDGLLHLAGRLDVTKPPYRYNLQGHFSNFDLAVPTNNKKLASDLNLSFDLEGRGIEPGAIDARLKTVVNSSVFWATPFSAPTLNCHLWQDSLTYELDAKIKSSDLDLAGAFDFSAGKISYSVNGLVQHLNIDRFVQTSGINSDLNFEISATGAGVSSESLAGDLQLQLLPSFINSIPLDSAQIRVKLVEQALDIHSFRIDSPLGILKAHGSLAIDQTNELNISGDFSDFSMLSPALPADSLFGTGRFSATITGPKDSLFVRLNIFLPHAGMTGLALHQFTAEGSGYFRKHGNSFDLSAHTGRTDVYGTVIDTVNLSLQYSDSLSTFEIDLSAVDSLAVRCRGSFQKDKNITSISISSTEVAFLQQLWQKVGKSTILKIAGTSYEIDEFKLAAENQSISLAGLFDLKNENRLQVVLNNIDISQFREQSGENENLLGTLNFNLGLNGTLANPVLHGRVELADGRFYAMSFRKFTGEFGFRDNYLRWQCGLEKTGADSVLKASGKLPLLLAFSPFQQEVLRDEPLELKFSTRGLDISFMEAFTTGVKDISGLLVADIVLRNTLDDLRGVGPVRLINGQFKIPEMGTKYRQFNIVLVLKDKEIIMQDLQVRSGGGYLKLLEGSLSIANDGLEEFSSRLRVKNFEIFNNKIVKARAKGIIELGGSLQSPFIIGDLTVDQARVNYKSFEEKTAVALTTQPFFVISSDSSRFDTSGALRFQKEKDVREQLFTESEFYRNLTGELSFFFPRNVWIRSADTNIEIRGKVVAVKEAGDFVLFGAVSTMRGFYELFGNRFQIRKGEIVFSGEAKMNPEIAIEATTIVTEEQPGAKPEPHEFTVKISGTLLFPEFKFLLDDETAAQEDIISILLFGQRYEDTKTAPNQTGNVNSEDDLDSRAKGILTGQLIKQLSNKLSKSLRLDVIQIESGDEPKIKVGKYVTPEVFVTVSQDFKEGNPLVELEYEIPKKILFFNLLLQASRDKKGATGLDVIWKMDW